MAIKLYGMTMSTCTRRVMAVLNEKNVPYELVRVNVLGGEHKLPEHMTRQPFGKIPVLDDDGFQVYESRAICKYIATKYADQGTKLFPQFGDLKAYALFEQACSVEISYFNPPAESIAAEKVFKKLRGLETDEANLEKQGVALDATLAVYEKILSKQKYLAGDELTVADLFHLPYGAMAKDQLGYGDVFAKYPAVDKWLTGLIQRESWVKASA